MPRTIDEGFRDFLAKLTPTSAETAAAKSHRASIESRLSLTFGMRRFFRIGSFGNGTSISGYSDVDYLAQIPTEKLANNSTYSLAKVRDALEERFPHTGVRVACPAVTVPFGNIKAETTEIVPADLVKESGGHPVYEIADCEGGWMRASPDAHNAYVAQVDRQHGGMVKPLVRFIKAWRCFREVPISSFYLELRVANYASQESRIVYVEDVRGVLTWLRANALADMYDPVGIGGAIKACKTDALRTDALSKLDRAATRAENAFCSARAGHTADTFEWLRQLYNNEFPGYYR